MLIISPILRKSNLFNIIIVGNFVALMYERAGLQVVLSVLHVLTHRLYGISHVTFMIAAAHFGSEFLIFRTVKINRASIWPLLIGSESSYHPAK